MRTETIYYIKCQNCGKEDVLTEEPNSYEEKYYYCKKCKDTMEEPKLVEGMNFMDFVNDLESWEYATKKMSKYFLSDKFEEDILEYLGKDGVNKKQIEAIISKCGQDNQNESRTNYIYDIQTLLDLIKLK